MKAPLLITLVLVGCGQPDPEPAPRAPEPRDSDVVGPYAVSATTLRDFDDRGQLITVEVWYPAQPTSDAELEPYDEHLQLVLDAYRDAEPDPRGAPYPTVAFSHGNGGMRFQSSYLCTWLASHGFVVVAPDHQRNTLFDMDSDAFAQVAAARPDDIRAAVDLVRDPERGYWQLRGLVEADGPYAVAGHSFGAWTSLAAGGGQVDFPHLRQTCLSDSRPPACGLITDAAMTELETIEPPAPDPRVAVAVALAPGLSYAFGPAGQGLADNVPTLVHGGTRDDVLPYDIELLPVFDALPASAALVTYEDAGHYNYSDLCSGVTSFEECREDAGYMSVERVHELSRVTSLAWLRARWLGEDDQERFLTGDYVEAQGDAIWTD